eukprot:CAMPEP_0194046096 /NCGR_PEP_ID=MMETSP0009_2-20130614/19458_1 /TAXON_ID=210454 /ORGANISM="Grammatophora oceanica, Strain CCMP 410" /LENGTH=104 /DNA_ID=CAMNT_0038691243 /DNA_START=242 /DNA_END=556 /DNA_ORIENTATION=-
MTNEKAVIMPSSMFIMSSFFLFRFIISSRVISRDSMKDKSSLGFLFPPKTCRCVVVCRAKTPFCAPGATNPSATAKTKETTRAETVMRDNMVALFFCGSGESSN